MSLDLSPWLSTDDAEAEPRSATPASFELLAGGRVAYERILARIDQAQHRIFVRCFEWRDDETGCILARHLLRAADRGVEVTVLKDRVGMHYEYLEGRKQSFFHKEIAPLVRMQTWFLMAAYGQWGALKQTANPLAAALLTHPSVRVVRERRFDHSKLYVFDDDSIILGGMGIGDDFRWRNIDFMVEARGTEAVLRYADRQAGRARVDPRRSFDYLLHSLAAASSAAGAANGSQPQALPPESLAEQRLKLIASARERLTIEMAYLGDRRFTDALVDAVGRGVAVTLLTAARANVIGNLNRQTCDQLLRRTRDADNLRVLFHPRMVHGKAIVVDGQVVDIGSANFTPLSHGGYEEVDLYARNRVLARAVEESIERDGRDAVEAHPPITFRRSYAFIERALAKHQARQRRVLTESAAVGACRAEATPSPVSAAPAAIAAGAATRDLSS